MDSTCIDAERIADVESLPEGHPMRQHVAECPRCQSLWLSYQSFMQPDVAGASNLDGARRSLAETIRSRAEAADAMTSSRKPVQKVSRWWLRPALVTAAAALLIVVAVSLLRNNSPEQPMLRGGSETQWSLQTPEVSDNSMLFAWNRIPGADRYQIEIFDDALNTVFRSAALKSSTATVPRAVLGDLPSGSFLSWHVNALKGGDVISTSPPSTLNIP
ncbi:MAG TPA: hypothetical protein VFH88_06795 [Candidatus Krumholzibacteria bacterium]|nr:hypothetical protein [Candidatus Krumholzibacteria bacterium]